MSTTILVGKGGTGKSTIAKHLLRKMAEKGVVAVDLDASNKTLSSFLYASSIDNTFLIKRSSEARNEEKALNFGLEANSFEIFKKACLIAKNKNFKHILIDSPAGVEGNRDVEPLLGHVNNIILMMTPRLSEIEAIRNIILLLKKRGLLDKTVVVNNRWPLNIKGERLSKVAEDIRKGQEEALKIEESLLRDRFGNRLVKDILVVRQSETINKGKPSRDIEKTVERLYETIERGYIPSFEEARPARSKGALVLATISALAVLIPSGLSRQHNHNASLDVYGETLLEEIEDDDFDYVTAFLEGRGFVKRIEPGESIEGVAFWAFQRFSGYFDLEEEGAKEEWVKYRRRFLRFNGYKKVVRLGEIIQVPPYEGKRSENYYKRMLMLEVIDDILNNAKITSLFMRVRSYGGSIGGHPGIDLEAPLGTEVKAFRAGKVVRSGFSRSYGYFVEIEDANDPRVRYLYAHLGRKGRPRRGKVLRKGDLVGYMGNSGKSRGPHLHFEVRIKAGEGWVETDPLDEIKRESELLVQQFKRRDESKY